MTSGWIEIGTGIEILGSCDAHAIGDHPPLECKEPIVIYAIYRRGECSTLPKVPMIWEWRRDNDDSWKPLYQWTPDQYYEGYIYTRVPISHGCGCQYRVRYWNVEKLFTIKPAQGAYTVSFHVEDTNGRILENANCLINGMEGSVAGIHRTCITDAAGNCSIDGVIEGKYRVRIWKDGYHCERDDCNINNGTLINSDRYFSTWLTPDVPTECKVIVKVKPPAAGYKVTIGNMISHYTDVRGVTVFQNVPYGGYKLRVEKDGYIPHESDIYFQSPLPKITYEVTMIPEPPAGKLTMEVSPASFANDVNTVEVLATIHNDTSETKEVKVDLRMRGAVRDTEPDLYWENVEPGKLTTISVRAVDIGFGLKNEYVYVDLREQHDGLIQTIPIPVGDPEAPPEPEPLESILIPLILIGGTLAAAYYLVKKK